MGQAWTTFAATLNGLIAEAEGHAQGVWTTNSGYAIGEFQESWLGREAPIASMREGAEAAAMIGAALSASATIVVALKMKVIAEVAMFARVCASPLRRPRRPGRRRAPWPRWLSPRSPQRWRSKQPSASQYRPCSGNR